MAREGAATAVLSTCIIAAMDEELNAFDDARAEEREEIRKSLDESALQMQRKRVLAETRRGAMPTLQERIAALGFGDEDGMKVFDLLPLVHVAWADGAIQQGERATILNLLQIRGLTPRTAWVTMESLLEKKPSDPYMEESLRVLRELVKDKPAQAKTIVGLCIVIAEAAGGFLGIFRRISAEEKAMIAKIADALGEAAQAEFRRQLGP
jgi:tellurite resistance protein